jgi:exodeoxyribonuclease V beta subunit
MSDDVQPFDPYGALPTGVTVLEASAGTGKTFTIAALATRYVAEGVVPLEQLLLITFTRMATGELRQRVRERMVSAEAGLTAVLGGAGPDPSDLLVTHLATGDVLARRDRLRHALANFEAATIDTTHAFCQRVLTGLGVAGDADPEAVLVEDPSDLIEEVVLDFYVRKFGRGTGDPAFSLTDARRIATRVVTNPDVAIHPPVSGRAEADVRTRFAMAVRDEVVRRRRRTGTVTFDDLLTRLRDTLLDPVRGDLAVERLRSRYRVALVDEFQDTDPIQWQILRRAFVDGGADATLVLIGDPKQAIYAFRGADVYSYLSAAASAGRRATLSTNWRSDQVLLDAFDAVFDGAALGHVGIVYRNVVAAATGAPRLVGAPVAEPLRFRVLHRSDGLAQLTPRAGTVQVDSARAVIAADLGADVVRLLSSGATIAGGGVVRPGDIAVLVQRNVDALAVQDALDEVGVPAVVNGAGSVFATSAARDWFRLLQALERPSATTPVRAAVLSSFFGWTAAQVAAATDEEWETVHARLHRWAWVLQRRGVAALFELVSRRGSLAGRLLGSARGERTMTDLRHVAQLLHEVAVSEGLGVNALVAWLHTRMDEADVEAAVEDRTRRLESDAEAVQVLTVFRSKGLEFPIVYCPYLWSPGHIDKYDPPAYHAENGERTVDVSGDSQAPGVSQRLTEARGEELRLLYVALTRARHQAVVWWAPVSTAEHSSLCRLLFSRSADGTVPRTGKLPGDDAAATVLGALAPGRIAVERVTGAAGPVRWAGARAVPEVDASSLRAAPFDRTLDPTWRRTSYSALTAAAHDAVPVPAVGSEADETLVEDEEPLVPEGPVPGELVPPAADLAGLQGVRLPLGAMRAGAEVGTFVHGVFERCDFASTDLDASLAAAFEAEVARNGAVEVGERASVLAGLRAAIETPLGPVAEDVRLRDIGRRDRVDELTFELPLVGGDRPSSVLTVAAIGAALAEHLPAGDPMLPYAASLADPVLAGEFRGYLTGSIDLVLRTPGGRYAVVDYKTNRLAPAGEELTAWHYRPEAVLDAMFRSHYPLQALLYTVALHRYLRWRQPGYTPAEHLAGILYLFVRGMVGPDTPVVDGHRCGVFSWRPPVALVEALSDLFDRGVSSGPSSSSGSAA